MQALAELSKIPLSVTGLTSGDAYLPLPLSTTDIEFFVVRGVLCLIGCVSSIAAHDPLHARSKPPRVTAKTPTSASGVGTLIPLEGG